MAHYIIRIARHATLTAFFAGAAVLGTATGVLVAYSGDLPRISALDEYAPRTITRIYGSKGEVIGEYATERRVVIGYDDISPLLREAIISAEDGDFNRHFGLSMSRIAVTLVKDVLEFIGNTIKGTSSRPGGASTLTQQLARNLFPEEVGFQVTPERKIKEALVALQIEKRYTKREILTLYCNHILFGHGTYGVEAASRLYFGKPAREVTLEEAAMLAGIIQLPARQSPYVDPEWTLRRRNYVLERMKDEGYITREEAEAAKAKPIAVRPYSAPDYSVAPYFVEEIRKYLERRYGAKTLYEGGLAVYSTLDVELQKAASRALDEGLRRIDKRRGFRKPRNVVAEGHAVDSYRHPRWTRAIEEGEIVPAVVTATGPAGPARKAVKVEAGVAAPLAPGVARVRFGDHQGDLDRAAVQWTGRRNAADILQVGDLVDVRVLALGGPGRLSKIALEQEPLVEGALVALDNRTGRILAMVGGYSFNRSKFNRAVQAPRQVGSAFKPFVFTAAIDRGFSPTTILLDAPVAYSAGAGQPPYSPANYDRKFEGPITIRRVIEQSRNVPTVRMMEMLGPSHVISYAKRLGITAPLQPYLSTALGACEATLLEMTAAYSVFPNQGVRMKPFQIAKVLDRDGNLLEELRPEPQDAIRADTAYLMTSLLRGVVQRGTAAAAASLDWPLAGKTGTTDDYTDAWFIGFDPDITAGVWVGHNEKKPIGPNETGSQAALPIWMDFMRAYIEARGNRQDPPTFEPPPNIVFLPVDRATGIVTDPSTPGAITEAFIAGTQPGSGFPR
ncbi:MAG: penicillin-binding protein 1A [Vicinamibacterales bacterium]